MDNGKINVWMEKWITRSGFHLHPNDRFYIRKISKLPEFVGLVVVSNELRPKF